MNGPSATEFNLVISADQLKPALLISLLSVWVLVGVFYFLNTYTRRRYFSIWTAAWLFYALWLTLLWGQPTQGTEQPPQDVSRGQVWLAEWCLCVSAAFLLWGSFRFLGQRVKQRLIALSLGFLLVWSYVDIYWPDLTPAETKVHWSVFAFIGLASLITAVAFFRYRRIRQFLGASLLAVGFLFWGAYMCAHPVFETKTLAATGFLISAVLQLLIAVSMIILVLEQVRYTHQRRDLFVREKLQNRVWFTEERYQRLFQQAHEAIVIAARNDLRIMEMNSAAESLLGTSVRQATTQSLISFCQIKTSPDKVPKSGHQWFELICSQQPLNLVHRNGTLIPADTIGAPVEFDGQSAYQFFFRAITDRLRLEQQLRQAEKLSSMGQMISGVAHELNNPLTVIGGYLEVILASHILPDKTRVDLAKVAHESSRATRLVRNFLAFARSQPAHRQMANINDLITGVVELRKFDLSLANVKLEAVLDRILPATSVEPDQIQQVLIILINNGMQAMSGTPDPRRIRLSTTLNEGIIRITVEDNGPGVPPEVESRIFEPFFTTKEVGVGTGLGLSIAHGIMSEHGGLIRYERAALGGAAFVLELPIVSVEVPRDSTQIESAPAADFGQAAPRMEKILVVDDEKAIVEMLGEMLGLLGYTPALCNSAGEGLKRIGETKFDLVLSDLRMPDIDGPQFYRKAMEIDARLARRFIFLTGDTVNEDSKTFLRSTGQPFLAKPFRLASIEEVTRQTLSAA
ncbi:MAG TPA: ATP-binding protein [Verrucomicrobiae bacterium]|jgi:PAS domain S-box-containing protein|nr:ATP-binding protein [Verrucomicrobiae bacterium]